MNRILVALDVERGDEAIALAETLRGVVAGYKVGSQLYTAEGPDVVRRLVDLGDRVFLDLKFHDIPNTVASAVRAAARLGVWMLNVHASGGRDMMRAAREAAVEAASPPLVIAVTVLTSLDEQRLQEVGIDRPIIEQVDRLAELADQAGLDGVVASPREVACIRACCRPGFLVVTPGIRGGAAAGPPTCDDQARTLSARGAIDAGADFLVVGRPIIAAPDPRAAAIRVAAEIGTA